MTEQLLPLRLFLPDFKVSGDLAGTLGKPVAVVFERA